MAPKDKHRVREWLRDRVIDSIEDDFEKFVEKIVDDALTKAIEKAAIVTKGLQVTNGLEARGAEQVLRALVDYRDERRKA